MDPALQELASVAGRKEIEAIVKLRDSNKAVPHLKIVTSFGNVATCRLPGNRIEEVWAHPNCLSLKAPRLLEYDDVLLLDEQSNDIGARETDRRRPEAIEATGRNVVIGVVDWGVDVAHPNFVRPDGSSRFLAVWDQRDAPSNAAPNPYGYGRVLTRDVIDAALATEDPYDSLGYHPEEGDPLHNGAHGTHVLDIAAGNGAAPESPMGLAPEADLVFVHLSAGRLGGLATLGDSVRILEALDFIRRTAGNRPWVINISLGRHSGGHRGLTLVEQGMDFMLMEAPGRAIVQSCGNYYLAHAHASGRLLPGHRRTLTWQTGRADVTPNELEIWYPTGDRFHVELNAPVGNAKFDAGLGEITPIVIASEEVGRIYHRKRDPTGEHHINIFLRPGAPSGNWQVELSAIDAVDGRFDAYVERDPGCPDCQSRFHPDDFEPRRTLGSICNGFHTIAVGAYDHHAPDRTLGTFSSSGPTRDGRQRPNLVAPGVAVLAARSAARAEQPVPITTRKTGTSMAAPHVTGTIALMFEIAPRRLSIRETHQMLLSTTDGADGDTDFRLRIGTGYLNIARTLDAVEGRSGESSPAREERETGSDSHIPKTSVNEPHPVLIENAVGKTLMPHTPLANAQQPSSHLEQESETPEGDLCLCTEQAIDVFDETWDIDEKFEELDERWENEEQLESWTRSPEELVDLAVEAVSSADIRRVMGPETTTSPALLFDSLACDLVPGVCEHLEKSFDVVALPGESLVEAPQIGDMVVVRALGEGDLAFADVIAEGCQESTATLSVRVLPLHVDSTSAQVRQLTDQFGRVDEKTLILRPRQTIVEQQAAEQSMTHGPVIHDGTFRRRREVRAVPRHGQEIEATWELVCPTSINPRTFFKLLSDNEWRLFRNLRGCTRCIALSVGRTGGGNWSPNDLSWSERAHTYRESFPFVWLTVIEQDIQTNRRGRRRINFGTDLFDDTYFDTAGLHLLNNNWVLRARRRWGRWRQKDPADPTRRRPLTPFLRRIMIASKKRLPPDALGLRRAEKFDIQRGRPGSLARPLGRRRPPNFARVEDETRAGLSAWQGEPLRSIGPVRRIYEDLRNSGVLPTDPILGSVMALDPQMFVRTLRSRYQYREAQLRHIVAVRTSGLQVLRQFEAGVQQVLNQLSGQAQVDARDFLRLAAGIRDLSLVANSARVALNNINPNIRVSVRTIQTLLPGVRSRRVRSVDRANQEKVVAETWRKLLKNAASMLESNGERLARAAQIPNQDNSTVRQRIRQIEAAGTSAMGIWFRRARNFFVPASRINDGRDFLIDTLDASGFFLPSAWDGIRSEDRDNRQHPDVTQLFHASVVNEVQIELEREQPFLQRIERLRTRVGQTRGRRRRREQHMLDGAEFVFSTYREAINRIARARGEDIVRRMKVAEPTCNWGWERASQGKYETGMSELRTLEKINLPPKNPNPRYMLS